MKIYTKTGDEGYSDVLQKRVKKSDKIFDLIGTLDKLNAVLSLGFNFCAKDAVKGEIAGLQRKLVGLNGTLGDMDVAVEYDVIKSCADNSCGNRKKRCIYNVVKFYSGCPAAICKI